MRLQIYKKVLFANLITFDTFLNISGYLLYLMGVTNEKIGDGMIKYGDDVYSMEAKSKYIEAIDYFAEAEKIYSKQKGMKSQLKNIKSRIEECKEKMNEELEDGIQIEADLSRILNQFEEKELAHKKKRKILKRLSIGGKKRKDAIEAAAFQSRKSQYLAGELSKTLDRAKDAVADTQFQTACNEFLNSYAIIGATNGKTSMEAASVLEKVGEVHVVMANKFKANKKVSQMHKDESFLAYSEALRVYKLLFSDDNVERVRVILKKIMHSFHMGELNYYFWKCPYICSHQVVFKDDKTYELMGNNCIKNRKFAEGIACFRRAYFAKKKVNGDDDMNVAFILTKMANIEAVISAPIGGVKEVDKVSSCFNLALNILQNNGDKDFVKSLKTMHKASAGEIMFLRGMDDVALQYYNECVDNVDYLVEKGCSDIRCVWSNLGEIFFAQSDYELAAKHFHKAVACRKEEDEEFAILSHCLGLVYEKQGDHFSLNEVNSESFDEYDKAIAQFEKASEVFEMVLGSGHDNVISTIHHIAYLYMKKREINEGMVKIHSEFKRISAPTFFVTLDLCESCGLVYEGTGTNSNGRFN